MCYLVFWLVCSHLHSSLWHTYCDDSPWRRRTLVRHFHQKVNTKVISLSCLISGPSSRCEVLITLHHSANRLREEEGKTLQSRGEVNKRGGFPLLHRGTAEAFYVHFIFPTQLHTVHNTHTHTHAHACSNTFRSTHMQLERSCEGIRGISHLV